MKQNFLRLHKKITMIIFLAMFALNALAFGVDDYFKKIEVGNIAAWINTFENTIPEELKTVIKGIRWGILFLFIALIFIYFCKPKLILIKHTSFASHLEKINEEKVRKDFYIKICEINLSDYINKKDIVGALKFQDETIRTLISKNKCEIGYYGIAHTPFIFRAGFMIGDQKNLHLFHKFRSNNSMFEEWVAEKSGWDTTLCEIKEENNNCKSNELFVAIGTSFIIKDSEMKSIVGKNRHVIIIQMSNLGFDVIGSYEQADIIRSQILYAIREREKRYDIRKMHLMISSSVAFTFFLASGFSAQHDPEIIVYNFQNGKYTWGINMSKSGEEAVVNMKTFS